MTRREQVAFLIMKGRDTEFIKTQVQTSTKFVEEVRVAVRNGQFKHLYNGK